MTAPAQDTARTALPAGPDERFVAALVGLRRRNDAPLIGERAATARAQR